MARILVVDDDPDQLEVRALVLEAEGHEVTSARNRRQAAEAFHRTTPDIVLMDLRLPRTEDGLALIEALRALSSTVPIIVLSGWTDDLRNHPSLRLINEVMPKPVRTQHLLGHIRRLTA